MNEGNSRTKPLLFLTDGDVETLADWDSAITAIKSAYSAPAEESRTPGRIFAQSEVEWMRIMPSIPTSGKLFGAKSIVGSFADGLEVSYLISLFDKQTAALVALIDGNSVTGLRTASTTAVGASTITPPGPLRVGIVGSGFEAKSHLTALSRVLEIEEAQVFSPTVANREAFASESTERLGIPVTAAQSAKDAVEQADLVLCAARSRDESPTIESQWVKPNAAVISIGSTTAGQRELPVELIDRASLIVVDTYDEVVNDSGDMIAAKTARIDLEERVITLNEAISRGSDLDVEHGIRIYKSTGSGLQDIVVAEMLVERAQTLGVGTILPTNIITARK